MVVVAVFDRKLGIPGLFVPCPHFVVRDGFIAREISRKRTEIARPLDVIVSAQRVSTGACASKVAGDKQQVAYGCACIRASQMLGHAHRPENAGRFGVMDHRGRLDQLSLAETGHFLRIIKRISIQRFHIILKPVDMLGDKLAVFPSFIYDVFGHR